MNIAGRQPSVAWEPVVIPELPSCPVWAWFKPSHSPHDVLLQIPDVAHRAFGSALILRRLLACAGIDSSEVQSWTVHGVTYPAQGGANSLLDQPVPPAGAAGIAVHMSASMPGPLPPAQTPAAQAAPVVAGGSGMGGLPTLEAIDAEWQSIIQIERQLEGVRRQLGGMQATLQSLNRDLDSDERLCADNLDKKEWQDARRWLRESLAHVSRYIRAHDIGVTSSAGNRRRFEEIYVQYVEPRRPFPGMETEQFAFEQHRKTNQSLLLQMQSTQASAARDGVQRAQMVLSRIAAKVRRARAKR